jgi:hypothetical protein
MCYSNLDEDTKGQLYYAIKQQLSYGDALPLDRYSRDKFIETIIIRDPELVATCLAKVRLGLPF